jgi:hypothetical protein
MEVKHDSKSMWSPADGFYEAWMAKERARERQAKAEPNSLKSWEGKGAWPGLLDGVNELFLRSHFGQGGG